MLPRSRVNVKRKSAITLRPISRHLVRSLHERKMLLMKPPACIVFAKSFVRNRLDFGAPRPTTVLPHGFVGIPQVLLLSSLRSMTQLRASIRRALKVSAEGGLAKRAEKVLRGARWVSRINLPSPPFCVKWTERTEQRCV